MSRKGLFVIVIGVVAATAPSWAQTPEIDTDKGHHLSPALQKRLNERFAQSQFRAAGEVTGPLVDRVSREWTIEAADCSLVKSQIKFSGVKKNTVWLTPNSDGLTYYLNLRREASGTAVDATGNKYVWVYNQNLDLDLNQPDLTETTKFTGSGADTLQLIALTPAGTGFNLLQFSKIDTPTLLGTFTPPLASNTPLGCNPF